MTEHNPDPIGAPSNAFPSHFKVPEPPIVARGSLEYRLRWGLMGLIFLVLGGWCAYDGFHKWPKMNAEAIAKGQNPPHGPPGASWDVPFNRGCGIALPGLGLATILWMFFNSRGAYRLEGDVLTVPGHPSVPLNAVRTIDKRKWDKKGIAFLEYERPDGGTGRLKLDDFIYQREPTDKIFERIEARLLHPADV